MGWEWDSESSRKRFRSLRLSSKRAFQRATFAGGAILLNHLVSAIDAAFQGRRAAREGSGSSVRLDFVPLSDEGGLAVMFRYAL